MGLIRKALFVTTVGAVAPNSKKQRAARQTLVAIQGGSPAQVRRAGGRYEHGPAAAIENARVARERAAQAQAQHTPRYGYQMRGDAMRLAGNEQAIADTDALLAAVAEQRGKSAEGLASWRREHPDAQ